MKSSAVNETRNLPTFAPSWPTTEDLPLSAGATKRKGQAYPWGGKPPAKYILAYRYVVDYLRKCSPQQKLSFMWSPEGKAEATKYYPGSHYVDYVGCSVFNTENRSFAETFAPVYQTLAQYGKPIIIAEFGVQAKHDQAAWVAGLKASASQFPLLKSVIYFNAVDPYPWVKGQKPDWRIDPALW